MINQAYIALMLLSDQAKDIKIKYKLMPDEKIIPFSFFENKEIVYILLGAFLLCWLGGFILLFSDNFQGAIPMGRVISAQQILNKPSIFENITPCYPPLHLYLIAFAIFITKNILIAPRILTLLFGIGLIWPFYFTVKMFTTARIAALSVLLAALTPDFIIQSTITMPEVPFLFFIFWGLYFFLLYKKNGQKKVSSLCLCALCLNLAFLLRYEAVVFVPILAFLLWPKKQHVFIFIGICSLAVISLMIINHLKYKNSVIFLTNSNVFSRIEISFLKKQNVTHALYYSNFTNKLFSWFKMMGKMTSPIIIMAGIWGLLRSITTKRFFYCTYLFIGVYIFFAYRIISETTLIQSRYALLLLLLFYPFVAIGFYAFTALFKKRLRPVITVLLIFSLAGFFIIKTYRERPVVPVFVKEISGWLGRNLRNTDTILMDRDKWETYYNDFIVYSQLPPGNFLQVDADLDCKEKKIRTINVLRWLNNKQINYVFYSSKGYLPGLFKIDDSCDQFQAFNCNFKRIFKYDLVYPEQGWGDNFEHESFQVFKVIYPT